MKSLCSLILFTLGLMVSPANAAEPGWVDDAWSSTFRPADLHFERNLFGIYYYNDMRHSGGRELVTVRLLGPLNLVGMDNECIDALGFRLDLSKRYSLQGGRTRIKEPLIYGNPYISPLTSKNSVGLQFVGLFGLRK